MVQVEGFYLGLAFRWNGQIPGGPDTWGPSGVVRYQVLRVKVLSKLEMMGHGRSELRC